MIKTIFSFFKKKDKPVVIKKKVVKKPKTIKSKKKV